MENDSLTIIQNEDKTYTLEWDKEDPKWKWLNNLTSKEIEILFQKAIQDYQSMDGD